MQVSKSMTNFQRHLAVIRAVESPSPETALAIGRDIGTSGQPPYTSKIFRPKARTAFRVDKLDIASPTTFDVTL